MEDEIINRLDKKLKDMWKEEYLKLKESIEKKIKKKD